MATVPKARILVTRFPYESRFGGEEVHTLRLMEELDGRDYESFFLGSCPVLLKAFKAKGFWVQKASLGKPPVSKGCLILFTILAPFLFVKAGWLLWRAKKRWNVNLLYALSFGEKLLMTPWARLFGMKVLWLEHARIGRWLHKNPWRMVYRRWSKWATVVVTSNAMVEKIRPFAKRVLAIPCGVILDAKTPLRAGLTAFIKSGFSMATVARLTPDKGVDILVACVQSKPDTRLVIVGDGPLRERLVRSAQPEQIRLLPSLPRGELMSLYASVDMVALASREMDPFGMVAAEAMAMGTPVLVTKACGIASDLVDGRDAVIVEPTRSEIDKGIKKLMKHPDLRARLGKAGKDFVEKHYRLEEMVRGFEGLLTK